MNRPSPKGQSRPGFTLVELLVVIGIIALLLGILLPVINAVRKSAYAADTKNQIRGIANAIDRYYNDQSAYPGIFSNTDITSGVSASGSGTRKVTGLSSNLTMSENLVLSLAGGLSGATVASQTYTAAEVGRGPLTMGTVQKRIAPYIEATSQVLSVKGSALDPAAVFGNGGAADTGVNAGVPEFIDRFPAAMPIVYIRAKVGAAGVYDTNTNLTQYNASQTLPYFNATVISTTDFPVAGSLAAGTEAYYGNSSISTAANKIPKNKDTYMLISPGPDRKYGTADDICNFSF